jgi:hypothetical protein
MALGFPDQRASALKGMANVSDSEGSHACDINDGVWFTPMCISFYQESWLHSPCTLPCRHIDPIEWNTPMCGSVLCSYVGLWPWKSHS